MKDFKNKFIALPLSTKKLWQLDTTIKILIIFIVILILILVNNHYKFLMFFNHLWFYVLLGVTFLLDYLFEVVIYIPLQYKSYRYKITNNFIYIFSGVFWNKISIIPVRTINYIEVTETPMSRKFNLVKIEFGTLSSTHNIAFITRSVAEIIKDNISNIRKGSNDEKN